MTGSDGVRSIVGCLAARSAAGVVIQARHLYRVADAEPSDMEPVDNGWIIKRDR